MSLATRISRDLTGLAPKYTVVVIGSGYGGGVAASRLARAGQKVCVLERGRELRPGEFPDRLTDAQGSLQIDTERGKLGAADGLFNVHVNRDMTALVGCGLGGTSLINANVGLEIDPRLFETEAWPAPFQADKTLLEPAYARARQMLDINPYPDSYPPLAKLQALRASAEAMGQPFVVAPVAVNFQDQANPFGVPQPKCTGCGDCCSGCNVGAKNTTLMNYLPDAVNHGAEIFTRARVDWLEPDGDGWKVHVVPNGDGAPGAPCVVAADVVVLGAGALGSTEILLRSREKGLKTSACLGRRFSGNGDVLAFGYDSYGPLAEAKAGTPAPATPAAPGAAAPPPPNLNAVGVGAGKLPADQYPGPCISGVIDMRNAADPKQGLVIEEGVIPGALAMALPPAFFFADALGGNFMQFGLAQTEPRLLDAKAMGQAFQTDPGSLGSWAYKGPVARALTYLVMSVDDAGGTLRLDNDRLRIDWPGAGREPSIARDNALIQDAARAIQAQFFPNPLWTEPLGKRLVTVHPVGGCGMGDDAGHGVVNHKGQVFAGETGVAVYPGLYVCDGAAMPGPVGVNPLLTITAVAERACELLAADRGWTIDPKLAKPGPLPPPEDAATEARHDAEAASLKHEGLLQRLETHVASFVGDLESEAGGLLKGLSQQLVDQLKAGGKDAGKAVVEEIIHRFPNWLSPKFQFTETMHGWASLRPVGSQASSVERVADDYVTATAWGKSEGTALDFDLTVHTDDLYTLISDAKHPAVIDGVVNCPALSPQPMKVLKGEFHLLPVDEDAVETWLMTYDLVLDRPQGPALFQGYKILHQRAGSNVWADVTTLFVTIRDGETGDGALLAQGTLTLDLEDLVQQGASIRLELRPGWAADLEQHFPKVRAAIAEVYLAKFAGFFGMTLFKAYGGMLADLNNFPAIEMAAKPSQRPKRALVLPKPQIDTLTLAGGFKNRLTRYHGGDKGPVLVAPGFGVRASSFAIDTVEENFAEALVAAHYDVWLFDARTSPSSLDAGEAPLPFTIDDVALIDWPAAIAHVRKVTGAKTIQTLAHCVPSMALMMSLAAGTEGVRSVIASQVTLHPVTDWMNYLKTDLNAAVLLGSLSQLDGAIDFSAGDGQLDHEIDAVAWNMPIAADQACKNPTCRRIFAGYGPSYDHAQLNHWTHTTMAEMFGPVSLKPFEQLQTIMRAGRALDAKGGDTYVTDEGAKRLALPITFLSGVGNQLFYPETAQRTRAWLAQHNDPTLYRQVLFPDYAHMDLFIGRNAAKEVFPDIIAELDRFN